MDVDTLSMEERNQLMKEGRCFKWRKTGHRANDCPEKQSKKEEYKKKMTGKDLYAQVRGLFKDMTEEEKNEFMRTAEEAGF